MLIAYHHIVATVDTTQSTNTNRMKLCVNGTQITSFSSTSYPSQNDDLRLSNSSYPHTIGEDPRDNTNFDGYIAEMHCLDGVAYDPSYFGETNSDGVWVPKEYTGGNYGTNGFFMEFKQAGATSANSSGKRMLIHQVKTITLMITTWTHKIYVLIPLQII